MGRTVGAAVVTGATGFLGQYLTRDLIARGHEVFVVTRDAQKSQHIFKSDKVTIIEGCFMAPASLCLPEQADIFHCAGITGSIRATQHMYNEVNIQGTRHLFELALKHQARTFNFVSSISAVGAQGHLARPITEQTIPVPKTYYGFSKLAAENFLLTYSKAPFPITIIRPSLIYGPGQSEQSGAGVLFKLCQNTLIPKLGSQHTVIPLGYVNNIASGFIDLSFSHSGTELFNLADPTPYSIHQLTMIINGILNKQSRFIHLPYIIGALCGLSADVISWTLKRDLGLCSELIKNIGNSGSHMSIDKALRSGYRPNMSLEEGLRLTLQSPYT